MGKSLHIGSAAITRSMDVALSENLGFFLSGSAPAPTPTPGGAPRGCHRLAGKAAAAARPTDTGGRPRRVGPTAPAPSCSSGPDPAEWPHQGAKNSTSMRPAEPVSETRLSKFSSVSSRTSEAAARRAEASSSATPGSSARRLKSMAARLGWGGRRVGAGGQRRERPRSAPAACARASGPGRPAAEVPTP